MILLIVALFLLTTGNRPAQSLVSNSIFSGKGLKLENIHYTQDDPDRGVKWVLDASRVKISEDKKNITFRDFQLRVKPEDPPSFKVEGKRGSYSRVSGRISLSGDVRGYSQDGYRLLTEHMEIDEIKGCLETDRPVKIFGPSFSIVGRGLFVNLREETFKIHSDVTTVLERDRIS